MLSLKALIAGAVQMPTIIFDEIDTGVSGAIAEKMAHIMREMGANNRQVISITHLPQIAALGSHHYKVYKVDDEHVTTSHIKELDEDQRITEIANSITLPESEEPERIFKQLCRRLYTEAKAETLSSAHLLCWALNNNESATARAFRERGIIAAEVIDVMYQLSAGEFGNKTHIE
jgi:energy-coupling factor transporter ATP-binding protein EcfA2